MSDRFSRDKCGCVIPRGIDRTISGQPIKDVRYAARGARDGIGKGTRGIGRHKIKCDNLRAAIILFVGDGAVIGRDRFGARALGGEAAGEGSGRHNRAGRT